MQTQRFRMNAPDVINEVIEGEAIILHLGTGRYYSARGCGAEAWSWLSASVPVPSVVEALGHLYDATPGEITAALDSFVGYLCDEKLIVAIDGDAPAAAPARPLPSAGGSKAAFEPPAMESFSDLEDLLLLDPVHEVNNELGWPHQAAPGGAA